MRERRRNTSLQVLLAFVLATCGHCVAPGTSAGPNPGPGSFAEVEGSKLYREECGTGRDAVVLIHDGMAHSAVGDDVWPHFCKTFHPIRCDRRGYGRTPAATTWYTESEDLAAGLGQRNVSHAVLVGSSHGGELSIDFAWQYPGVVEQLVVVGAVVDRFPYADHFLIRGTSNSRPFENSDVAAGLANWAKDKYLLAAGPEAAQKRLLALLTANPQDMTYRDYARPTAPAIGRFDEIRVPTPILVGDADIPDVHAHAGAMEAGIPGSRRVVISDAGHLM